MLKDYFEKLFNDNLDIELIVVLRNQADLLESLYHEMYYAFSKVNNLNTPEKFIEALNKDEYEDFFNNFDFEIFKLYEDSFDINILFYEDISEDVFFQQLADILKYDSCFIKEIFLNNSLNNRKYKGNTIEKKVGVSSLLIEFLYNTNMINVYFKIQKLLFARKIFRSIKYLFDNIKYKKIKTRRFTEEEKIAIYNYYKSKNRSLLKYKQKTELSKNRYI